jgi:hypothetical protein
MALSTASAWMSNFVVAFVTPPLFDVISGGYYFVLLGFCVLSGFVVFFVYPETAHVTLEQLSQVFGDAPLDSVKPDALTPLQLALERSRSTMVSENSNDTNKHKHKLLLEPKNMSNGNWAASSTTLGNSTLALDTPTRSEPDHTAKIMYNV